MATPATGAFSGTPASIIDSDPPQTEAIEDEPFDSVISETSADRVGEVRRRRQHRLKRAPGELAVADLAPARRTDAARFADRVGREVVVQQEVRLEVAVQRVDELFVVAGAQRGDDQRLRLAPGEQRRAMRARQKAGFGDDGRTASSARPSIRRPFLTTSERRTVDSSFLSAEPRFGSSLIFAQAGLDRVLGGGDGGDALLLVEDRVGLAHLRLARGLHGAIEVRVIGRLEVEGFLRGILGQVDDQVDHRLDLLMREIHRAQHLGLGKLVGLRFHHHHGVLGARHDEVEPLVGVVAQVLHVVDGGVQDVLAILEAHAAARDRPHEGRARDGQRGRGRDHRHDVGIVDEVVAQHGAHDQHFVLEAGHEERADRTVDQARGQRLLLGRPRLALEEAAGHLAGGVVFFLVVDGQREEILPGLGSLAKVTFAMTLVSPSVAMTDPSA
jgi:hypothetical protein